MIAVERLVGAVGADRAGLDAVVARVQRDQRAVVERGARQVERAVRPAAP